MTMTLTSDTRVSLVPTAFAAVTAAVTGWRTRHARRAALAEMGEMTPRQLDDIGVSIGDVHRRRAQR